MAIKLQRELETYEKHRAELLARARGQFALIKGDEIVDTFFSREDALKSGYTRFGNAGFLVKQILDVDQPVNFTSFNIAL